MTGMFRVSMSLLLGLCLLGSAAAAARPGVLITLGPSLPSPELLGSSILWTTNVQGQQGHTYDYQYSVSLNGNNQIVRDFQVPKTFTWVPWTVEGNYTVSVVVRDITTPPYIVYPPVSRQYTITPIVTQQGQSAVNTTSHPLVALFSAGPCTAGHSIRVRFRQNGSQTDFAQIILFGKSVTAIFSADWIGGAIRGGPCSIREPTSRDAGVRVACNLKEKR